MLGETASPQTLDPIYCYCERSMWIVFGRIFGIEYSPIKDIHAATCHELETYTSLKDKVLESGVCIWDVYSDIHGTLSRNGKNKRQKRNKEPNVNDIVGFCKQHPSLEKIVLIGQKARASFARSVTLPDSVKVSLATVPSSSPAYCRISLDEKVRQWKREIHVL
jgi:hypoxanthine-DNA glycosylase